MKMQSVQELKEFLDKLDADVDKLSKADNYDDLGKQEVVCVRTAQLLQISCNRLFKELQMVSKSARRSISIGKTLQETSEEVIKEDNGSGDNRSEATEVAKPVRRKRTTTKKTK